MVTVKKLNVFYEKFQSLKEVDCTFDGGYIYGITGPNGAGKTTLLKALSGILKYYGSIKFNDKEMRDIKSGEKHRLIGFLPHRENIPYGFTLLDMILMGSYKRHSIFHAPDKKDRKKAEEIMEEFDIHNLKDKRVETLSTGEFTLGRISRVFVQDPQYILFDEIFSHLDLKHVIQVMKMLKSMVKGGKTVIIVSHNLNLLSQYSDYIYFLNRGEVVLRGSPHHIIQKEKLREIYGVDLTVVKDPDSGIPGILYPQV